MACRACVSYTHLPRCPYATDRCEKEMPELIQISDTQKVRCWNYDQLRNEAVK